LRLACEGFEAPIHSSRRSEAVAFGKHCPASLATQRFIEGRPGRRAARATEHRDELASLQLIELHSVPARRARLGCVVRDGMHSAIASVASALDPRGYFVGWTGRETDLAQPVKATDPSNSIRAPLTMGLFVPDVA
jgi:hypothetical protein